MFLQKLFLTCCITFIFSCNGKSQFHVLKANYSKEYKEKNNGKVIVDIPEVQELVQIIISITPKGLSDSDLVNHETNYYKDVQAYFYAYRNHAVVAAFDKLIKNSTGKYAKLKMSSCNYYFENQKIEKDSLYENIGWDKIDFVKQHIKELEDFAIQTNFRQFYIEHKPYYDILIKTQIQLVDVKKQWVWLEKIFPSRYNCYKIFFSPLVNGSHSTARFSDGNFNETMMFICAPFLLKNQNSEINKAILEKIVFTEIDHNYVNPMTAKFNNQIDNAIKNKSIWTNGLDSRNYNSKYAIFNEYMTFSIFLMYCLENYSEENYVSIKNNVIKQVSINRGFTLFEKFYDEMFRYYKKNETKFSIESCYLYILDWCKTVT